MPPGRQPIETRVIAEDRLGDVVEALGRHIATDGQAYWVCPLVEESEKSDLAAAEDRAATLRARFGDKVGLIHGRMQGPGKDAVMAARSEARRVGKECVSRGRTRVSPSHDNKNKIF